MSEWLNWTEQWNIKCHMAAVTFLVHLLFRCYHVHSLISHALQHASLPCPSLSPGIFSNSCPLSRWCHHIFSSSVILLLPSIFPIIRVFSSELLLCIGWPKYWSFSLSISLSVDAEIWFQVRPVQESSEAPKPVATSVLATVATAASAQTWYEKWKLMSKWINKSWWF